MKVSKSNTREQKKPSRMKIREDVKTTKSNNKHWVWLEP